MPSTITSYTTFQANTKARASQVNTNFSNYRGTLLPIEELTATASHLAHDLGSSEHRWAYGYVEAIDLRTSTTTSGLTIIGDVTSTLGAFKFNIGGTEYGRVSRFSGTSWDVATITGIHSFRVNGSEAGKVGILSGTVWDTNTTTGVHIFKVNGVEKFRVNNTGFTGVNNNTVNMTTSAYIARSIGTTAAFDITGTALTITTGGRTVLAHFIPNDGATTTSSNFGIQSSNDQLKLSLLRSGSTVGTITWGVGQSGAMPAHLGFWYDTPAAGTYTYSAQVIYATSSTQTFFGKFRLIELGT